jgi:hypothetical protein
MRTLILAVALALSSVASADAVLHSEGSLQCTSVIDTEIKANRSVYINAGSDVHIADGGTRNVIILPSDRAYIKYTPANPSDWKDPKPAYVWDALDRLATALSALGVKP